MYEQASAEPTSHRTAVLNYSMERGTGNTSKSHLLRERELELQGVIGVTYLIWVTCGDNPNTLGVAVVLDGEIR